MNGNILKITFCGDIMVSQSQIKACKGEDGTYNFTPYFEQVKKLFQDSDYVVSNLETTICPDAGLTNNIVSFNTPVEILDGLKYMGVNFVSTANNHCLDRGVEGLESTIRSLDKYGISHSGTSNTVDWEGYHVASVKGFKIAFVCCTFGTNSHINGIMLPDDQLWRVNLLKKQNKKLNIPMNLDVSKSVVAVEYVADDISPAAITNKKNLEYIERIKTIVKEAKANADFVVVMPHVGGQYNPAPGLYARYIMDEISSLNVALIIGGHPHVPLKSCMKHDALCVYSLGNFAATPNEGWFLPNTLSEYGVVLHVYIDKKSATVKEADFNIVKNVVGQDGITRVIPLDGLYADAVNLTQKERLRIDNEAVFCRFAGKAYDDEPMSEYKL